MLKTVSSIANAIGALNYKGTWNASTNTPTLTSGSGTKGDYYVVSVAGSTALDGISNWGIGDWVAFNGSAWQRVEGGADLNGVNLSVSGTSNLAGLVVPSAGVKGISTNTDAAAGNVGEYISSTVAYNAVNLTSGVQANVTSILLTAGDWDVVGACLIDGPVATVVNYVIGGLSSTSATMPVSQYRNAMFYQGGATPFSTTNVYANPPPFRFSLSATTTIYLVVWAGFSVSTLTAGGYMAARRVQPGA